MFTMRPPAASTAGRHTSALTDLRRLDRAIFRPSPSGRTGAGEVGVEELTESRRSDIGEDMPKGLPVANDKAPSPPDRGCPCRSTPPVAGSPAPAIRRSWPRVLRGDAQRSSNCDPSSGTRLMSCLASRRERSRKAVSAM